MVECCNTPDVTSHICNSNYCHFRLCVMIFPSWSGFVSRFAFCSCHAFHITSSCASHLHTCSSHASEHFPRCPFCNTALLSPPVHPSCFLSCACVKLSRNGPRLVKWLIIPPGDYRSSFVPFGGRLVLQRLTGHPQSPFECPAKTPSKTSPKPTKLSSMS